MSSTVTSSRSILDVSFVAEAGRTRIDRVFESGALRLRCPKGAGCEGIIVNTGGGIVGGDRVSANVALEADAEVTLTTVAAEKVYRTSGPAATIDVSLTLERGARLDWLPQETILFDASALERSFTATMAGSARLLAAEILVFGRLASAEPAIDGTLRDRWRVRRDGRLVFADESRLSGAIGGILDRPATGGGARAVALLLFVAPEAETLVDPIRDVLAAQESAADVEAGVSAWNGILVARALASSPERLRSSMVAALTVCRGAGLPRVWA